MLLIVILFLVAVFHLFAMFRSDVLARLRFQRLANGKQTSGLLIFVVALVFDDLLVIFRIEIKIIKF